jgi:chemotaxis methyl-accepting protein methylase
VVGIGCSAGGLEALEKFFTHVPAQSGLAYVVVQHLDPTHTSALPELLRHFTAMEVLEAGDSVLLEPDHVYVIAPNKDLSVLHGVLHTIAPAEPRGHRLPIDFFFRTLADDLQERAIGVILSGMGSDGVMGLRAIKEKAGLTMAQEPGTAQASSMPASAIEAELVDIVAAPELLPARIVAFVGNPVLAVGVDVARDAGHKGILDKIVILLRDRCGNDFSLYKNNTLFRRIERRIALHQLDSLSDYVRYLRENPHEVDFLFKELLIGVTSFFRDPALWEHLRSESIPALLARHPEGGTLRAWVPACSTGEEAYSLAMVFREAVDALRPDARFTLQLYATDLDQAAIDRARKGVYPANIAADLSPERLSRYFVLEDDRYRLSKDIREMVVFAQQNIISDPPFTKLDLLSCRNLLIYFTPALQKKLLPLFHYALRPGGLLLLGSAETVGEFSRLFAAVDGKLRIFSRTNEAVVPMAIDLPFSAKEGRPLLTAGVDSERVENVGALTDQLIQQNFAPAAVLVNAEGDILYISGHTGKYLEPAAGKMNINIHAMARVGLREALAGTIHRALRDAIPLHLRGLTVDTDGLGGKQLVNLTVQALTAPEPLRGRVIIVFEDVAALSSGTRRTRKNAAAIQNVQLEELQQMREALQITREEMQTSIEELKSSNEEQQSTNEELQSSNEELITSKEELQSLNEELQTVNAELQSKIEDLTWVRNDMANLLNSTQIATIFLDIGLKVRRFTNDVAGLFKLIPGDVGRPLSDIVTELDYPSLRDDTLEVLRTLAFRETQVATRDGRWFRVRIMPYRTLENVIDGVVITFFDITEIKKLEAQLRSRGEA